MKICLLGKFPPIQGGVAARTWRYAHALAALGHEVHVVTNALDASPPHRIFMRPSDWVHAEVHAAPGAVKVHWCEPYDSTQRYLPSAPPFVSKLAGRALQLVDTTFDVIFSFYLEPYAVAGHLVATARGLPHVIKTAGSDLGRLAHNADLKPLYAEVMNSANAVLCGKGARAAALTCGVLPERLATDGEFALPAGHFSPDTPPLNLEQLLADLGAAEFATPVRGTVAPGTRYVCISGKLGQAKALEPLLAAMAGLARRFPDVALLVVGQVWPGNEDDFWSRVLERGLQDRVVQLPFLPPWRMVEVFRRAAAACFLEHRFPIHFHGPSTPREAMLAGTCVVLSGELWSKLPECYRVVDGFNASIVDDPNDVAQLTTRLAALLSDPDASDAVGERGRAYALRVQQGRVPGQTLAALLTRVVAGEAVAPLRVARTQTASTTCRRIDKGLMSRNRMLDSQVSVVAKTGTGDDDPGADTVTVTTAYGARLELRGRVADMLREARNDATVLALTRGQPDAIHALEYLFEAGVIELRTANSETSPNEAP